MKLFSREHAQLLKENYPSHEEYEALLSSLSSFLEERVMPLSHSFDSSSASLSSARRELMQKGICQIAYPEEYGGLSLPFGVYCAAMELVGSADASIALSVGIHNTAAEGIFQFGSDYLKSEFLPDILSGKKIAAFCLTEPTSGSDAKSMATKARRSGGEYVINGSKMFITNAGEADAYLVFAATEHGHSCFLVEKSTPGLEFGEDIQKLGMRGTRTSEVRFVDCRVPATMLVGREGIGFEYAKALLNGSRIVMGSICVGIARTAFEKALDYSRKRRSFGKPISDFQLTREKIADMKTAITAGRLLCMHASRLKEMGEEFSSEASQAKVFSTEMSLMVCDAAIQLFGGYGYTDEDVHRHWRDARLLTIGEGTSEVLRMLIASKELARSL